MFTKTHNRSVVGVSIEIVKFIQMQYPTGNDIMNAVPIELNKFNNKLIYKPINYQKPKKYMKEQIQEVFSQSI
ncbi:DUF6933 domain-containing protein [Neobacillus drentensis]|uniref:DUF6933 domain-containing protein n=1 Tax=Neobacillus drentensis TaxID=220684 RepID=UPI003B589575